MTNAHALRNTEVSGHSVLCLTLPLRIACQSPNLKKVFIVMMKLIMEKVFKLEHKDIYSAVDP